MKLKLIVLALAMSVVTAQAADRIAFIRIKAMRSAACAVTTLIASASTISFNFILCSDCFMREKTPPGRAHPFTVQAQRTPHHHHNQQRP